MGSNGQGPVCGAVKRSSKQNDGQNFLTPVAAVTTASIGVTTPCLTVKGVLEMYHYGSHMDSGFSLTNTWCQELKYTKTSQTSQTGQP